MLQYRTDSLQAHTGIHGWFWQFLHGAVSMAVKLHEHDVPDFNIAVTILFRRTRRTTPNMITMIVENLSTRTTRTGIPHLPEVIRSIRCAFVVTDTNNAFCRNTDFFMPNVIGFIIGFVHGHP